jgi:hypothetical protein
MNYSLPENQPSGAANPSAAAGASLRPVLRRTWLWLALVGVLSAGIGAVATWFLAKDLYVYSGTLLFNESYLGSPTYRPPDVFSLATLMKAPRTLDQLRKEFNLAVPLMLLERRIEVEARHGSTTVNVELEWESPEDAEKMLNRLMEMAVERSRDFRNSRLDFYVQMFEQDFHSSESKFGEVRKEILEFYQDEHTTDLDEHMRTLAGSLKGLKNELAYAQARRKGTKESLVRVRELLATEESTAEATDPQVEQHDTRATEVARAQIKKLHLEEQIKEYQDKTSAKIMLDQKQRDLERARRLFERKYISATELEELESEVKLLTLQMREDEHMKEWKQELERVSQIVQDNVGTTMALSGIASNHLSLRVAELEATLEMEEEIVIRLTEELADRQQELERVMKLRPQGLQLAESLEDVQQRRDDLGRQLVDFHLLERSDASMFTLMEPASPAIIPVISTKKKIFAAVTGASFFALAGPILLLDFLRQNRRAHAVTERSHGNEHTKYADTGLPLYAGRSLSTIHAITRAISVASDHKGYTVLFTSLTSKPLQQETMLRCAADFAQQGEPVMLVDPGLPPAARRQFATLLQEPVDSENIFEGADNESVATEWRQVVARLSGTRHRTSVDGVDAVVLDGTRAAWEDFVNLVPQLSQRYSYLLIAGPPVSDRKALDRLLDDTDAVLLTTEQPSLHRKGWKFLDRCRNSGTHILGVSLRRDASSQRSASPSPSRATV